MKRAAVILAVVFFVVCSSSVLAVKSAESRAVILDPTPAARPIPKTSVYSAKIPKKYFPVMRREAEASGVPLWLAARLIESESGWWAEAVNVNKDGSRDLGLAQLNETWLDDFAARFNDGEKIDPFDEETSVRVALRYLADLFQKTGNWRAAVASYNCGLSRYRTGRIPAITVRLVERVFQASK